MLMEDKLEIMLLSHSEEGSMAKWSLFYLLVPMFNITKVILIHNLLFYRLLHVHRGIPTKNR